MCRFANWLKAVHAELSYVVRAVRAEIDRR